MRTLETLELQSAVRDLFLETAFRLPARVEADLRAARETEESPQGREVLGVLLENMRQAKETRIPLCQDTGLPQIRVECGLDVRWTGGTPLEACELGAREAYREGALRRSGCTPVTRENLGDLLPVSVETELVEGDRVTVYTLAKGGGCDNKSLLTNLPPTSGREAVVRAAASVAITAGPDACPPFYLGICVGGSFESAPRKARLALWGVLWGPPPTQEEEDLASDIRAILDASGLGPMCVGGRTTVLGLRVIAAPSHIASLPVAVNLCCHSFRPGMTVI
jgi:fumarate hydratase subunit alpha